VKVLLIHQPDDAGAMTVLPLGAACIAAALERDGHEVRQLALTGDPAEKLEACLADFAAGVIGVSVRNIDDQTRAKPVFFLDGLREAVACCRRLSSAPIVLGGAGFSIFPQSVLSYLKADFGLRGEGERAFALLLDCLEQGKSLDGVPGLFRPDMPASPPGDCLRLGDWPLPRPGRHLALPELPDREFWVPVQSRRGCPMGCSYCSTPAIEGERLRCRPVGQVVDHLAEFAAAGCNHFYMVDNTFNLPRDYAEALCDRIIEAGLNINWRAILYPWQVSGRLIAKMARAGCVEVSFGSESGSETMLGNYRKRFAPEEARKISLLLKENGIRQLGFWLLGGPGEDRCTVQESLEFFDSLPLDALKVTAGLRIYPQTPLAHQALAEGVVAPDDDLLLPRFYLADGLAGWLPDALRVWAAERPHWLLPPLAVC
jgi:radical SAM superfamily enzyme YgiQ (UPF0313 family)